MSNSEPLLTVADVAKRANVHPETVRRWTRDGLLPVITLPRGGKRYDPAVVDAILTPQDAA